jgi:hypothetical protein
MHPVCSQQIDGSEDVSSLSTSSCNSSTTPTPSPSPTALRHASQFTARRQPGLARMLRSADRFLLGVLSHWRGHRQEEDEVRVYPLINPARPPSERPPIPVASFMSRTTDLFASASSYRVIASSGGLLTLTRRGREQRKEVCVCDLAHHGPPRRLPAAGDGLRPPVRAPAAS